MDKKTTRGAEFLMRGSLLIVLFGFSASLLVAQQRDPGSLKSQTKTPPSETRQYDPAIVAAAIRGSYYHPDDMSGLDCMISVDWPAFFSAVKMNPAPERLKAIEGLKIRSRASRGKIPDVTFDWAGGSLDNKEQFEGGMNQMLGGFYQVYWAMLASSPVTNAAELTKIEPLPNGGIKVYSSSQNTKVVITADEEDTPTHYTLESPAMNGTIDLHYVTSPNPVPGDLRRVSSMDLTEQIGASTMNVKLSLDYQSVDSFFAPRHVSYYLVGAYSLSMDFSGCSIPKPAIAH